MRKDDPMAKVKTSITFCVDKELAHQFKIALATEQETAQAVLERAVKNYVVVHEKKGE